MGGRRLKPWEVAEVAAAMGLPVSQRRGAPETPESKARRIAAYAAGVALDASKQPIGESPRFKRKRTQKGIKQGLK
jgi:hypothetical protein